VRIGNLKKFQDCTVVLQLIDGETLKAKIALVDGEYDDIVVEVVQTNKPEHYKDLNSADVVKAADILTIERSQPAISPLDAG
jgi:hypothetical protein